MAWHLASCVLITRASYEGLFIASSTTDRKLAKLSPLWQVGF